MKRIARTFQLADTGRFGWGRILFFLVLSAIFLYLKFDRHELWKDEWQAWLITRDLPLGELLGQLYYEGHPALWYFYLKLWVWLPGPEDVIFQIAHALPVLLTFWLLIFRFRLSFWLTILLPTGFFLFFEYGLVNRGYVLVTLLAFLLSLELRRDDPRPLRLALWTVLLCQTEVYGLFMALGFGLYYLLRLGGVAAWSQNAFRAMLGGGLVGSLLFLATVFPRQNADITANAYPDQPFAADHLATVFQGTHVNTYWLGSVPDTNVFGTSPAGLILSALVLGLLVFFFWRVRSVLAAFLLFQALFFFFSLLVYPGGVRHWGCAVVFFIALLPLFARDSGGVGLPRLLILLSILGFQWYYHALGLEKEWKFPFSQAKAAAAFIEREVPASVPVLSLNKFHTTAVAGYLERPLYALPEGEPYSYFRWAEKIYVPPPSELTLFAGFMRSPGLMVINGEPVDTRRYPNLELVKSFDSYSIKNESFYLYRLVGIR